LKTLPFWLPCLRRRQRIRRRINAPRITAPATDPTTIPAIAPPDNPLFELELVAAVDEVADELEEVADAVGEFVENVMDAVIVGSTTLAHLCSAFEL
jgi:HAMP domain-containing protein